MNCAFGTKLCGLRKSAGIIVLKARRIIQPMVLTIGKDSGNDFRSVGTEHNIGNVPLA